MISKTENSNIEHSYYIKAYFNLVCVTNVYIFQQVAILK